MCWLLFPLSAITDLSGQCCYNVHIRATASEKFFHTRFFPVVAMVKEPCFTPFVEVILEASF